MRVLMTIASVWTILFVVPVAVYGFASPFLDLKEPVGPAWRFLSGVAVTKLGTAVAFVTLFALLSDAWREHWFVYGAIWFVAFAASELGDLVRQVSGPSETILGVLSEVVYAPASAFMTCRLLRRIPPA